MKIYIILFVLLSVNLSANVISIGKNGDYEKLSEGAAVAKPGDTLYLFPESHSVNQYIENLHGTQSQPICIISDTNQKAVFSGGKQAIHFVNVSWLYISGLVFENQKINGVNIDDGGDYSTPTHHIVIEHCVWRGMNATGNNDELKMSGVDSFSVRYNTFSNGSDGGSLVDMVGCHWGVFEQNKFEDAGSNCIQAKGGTRSISIFRNHFKNGGRRSINCGGSTDLPFFRPINADYEAKNIDIYSNIFVGSTAAIAFVTATECRFINNTIVNPKRWVLRVLQETDKPRFIKCNNNTFSNNICYFNNEADHEGGINLGSNTQAETFKFFNNLWYNRDNPIWDGPNTNFCHRNSIINSNPKFINVHNENFSLDTNSPAISSGKNFIDILTDYYGKHFKPKRCIGAIEYKPDDINSINSNNGHSITNITPNPATDYIDIVVTGNRTLKDAVKVYDIPGNTVLSSPACSAGTPSEGGHIRLDVSGLAAGVYFVRVGGKMYKFVKM